MSTLKVTNIQATGETATRAVSGVAAAWVNFNGTGTPAIRDSQGVASLTDNGTGSYSVNFTNNMANANYATTTATAQFSPYPIAQAYEQGTATTAVTLNVAQPGTADYDSPKVLAQVCGDLA